MKEFIKSLLTGFGIGSGVFLSYLVIVIAIKSNVIPSIEELSVIFQSLDKTTMVHAIGVYEGGYSDGVRHRFDFHPEGKVVISIKNNPNAKGVILILSSYEPVLWRIDEEGGTKVEKIILSGNYPSRVTGITGIPIFRESLGYAYEKSSFSNMEMKIKEITGLEVNTFQGSYKGKYFDIF